MKTGCRRDNFRNAQRLSFRRRPESRSRAIPACGIGLDSGCISVLRSIYADITLIQKSVPVARTDGSLQKAA